MKFTLTQHYIPCPPTEIKEYSANTLNLDTICFNSDTICFVNMLTDLSGIHEIFSQPIICPHFSFHLYQSLGQQGQTVHKTRTKRQQK